MRYLTFLMGVTVDSKQEIDLFTKSLSPLVNGSARYVYTHESMTMHFDSDTPYDELKTFMGTLCEEYGFYFIMSPFPDRMSTNLPPEDCLYLFDLNSEIKFDNSEAIEHYFGQESKGDRKLDYLFGDDEDDDEDDNVVQELMEKYRLKEEEPTIDEILEKIHEKGLSSLSIQEQAILNSYN
jgi:hypothetical protein